ncbi:uncharacterized protein LOC134773434 [Penaeus indicus]|uniref:uncharacterized protein LOC134773433 n=1 Tax=Penaeus indicus TaxID=29960 RepID=UPI00300D2F50
MAYQTPPYTPNKRDILPDETSSRKRRAVGDAENNEGTDRIAWQIKEVLLPSPVSILKIDDGLYTIYSAERVKRDSGEDLYILSMHVKDNLNCIKRVWCPISFRKLLTQYVNHVSLEDRTYYDLLSDELIQIHCNISDADMFYSGHELMY